MKAAMNKLGFTYVDANQGVKYYLNRSRTASSTVKLAPSLANTTEFSLNELNLLGHATVQLEAYKWVDQVLFAISGSVEVDAGEHHLTLEHEGIAFIGRGHRITLRNLTDRPATIGLVTYPPGVHSRADLLISEGDELFLPDFSSAEKKLLGLIAEPECHQMAGAVQYIAPDDGASYWQADPSAGYITVKLSEHNLPSNQFAVSVQSLDPGAYVRQHGHRRTDELIVITSGTGFARVAGEDYPLSPGSLVLLHSNVIHGFHNTGDVPLNFTAFLNPPGIESALSETGVARTVGHVRPSGIARNEATGRILVEKYGFILPNGGG
jgi:quercetin dioxygenase-like cupin family protein